MLSLDYRDDHFVMEFCDVENHNNKRSKLSLDAHLGRVGKSGDFINAISYSIISSLCMVCV